MKDKEIVKYLRKNIEPIKDRFYGNIYRGSVYMNDDLFLPCVNFLNAGIMKNLLVKNVRMKNKKYNDINKNENHIDSYEIKEITPSKFAIPIDILKNIESETSMSWTGFIVEMIDGKLFNYGTSFSFYYFDLPEGYLFDDIKNIINHSIVLKNGVIQKYRETLINNISQNKIYREKCYFECYIDNL